MDLTASGRTLEENHLGGRGDRRLHRAPDREPRVAQAQGRRRSTGWWSGSGHEDLAARRHEPGAGRSPSPRVALEVAAIIARGPRGRRRRGAQPHRALRQGGAGAGRAAGRRRASWSRRSACSSPRCWRALRTAIANVRAVAKAQLREPVAAELPEGQRVEVVEVPGPARGGLRAGRPRALPLDRRDGRRDGARRRRGRDRGLRPARARAGGPTRRSSPPACCAR